MADQVGNTIGPYQITEPLGVGGMGEVYKAYHTGLEVFRAIKFIRPELSMAADFRARFQKEARSVARLRHPNIVQVHDFGEHEGCFYMVMEYVDGQSLKAAIANHEPMDTDAAVALVKEIAGALDYAHQQGLIHRDIKPDNIMLDSHKRAVLMDFGIARLIIGDGKLTATGVVIGSAAYMAPEQSRAMEVGPYTDVYSLSVVLFELLTGRAPFRADLPFALVLKSLSDPMPMPRALNPNISEELQSVILKGTAKDVSQRYQTAAEFRRALDDLTLATGKPWKDIPSPAVVGAKPPGIQNAQPPAAGRGGVVPVSAPLDGEETVTVRLSGSDATSRIFTLVFTDLADSMVLKRQHGDQSAGELFARHRSHVRSIASDLAGRIIDWAGDGCFLTFQTPSAAVAFALRLQQAHKIEPDLPGVRIGMHMGEVGEGSGPDGDANHPRVEGLAVDIAARICGLARPAQVLMSSGVADSARQRLDSHLFDQPIVWRSHGVYALKGFDEPLEIREVGIEGVASFAAPAAGEKAVPVRPSRSGATSNRSLRTGAIASVLAIAIAGSWWWMTSPQPGSNAEQIEPRTEPPVSAIEKPDVAVTKVLNSIAVLPFADMSENKDQEYLADGVAEEILNLLAQVPDLLVSARTSSFYFKGKQTKIPDIARELGVANVLEGSIRRSGDRLRVTAQLVRADNGYHLWSETYDRDLHDVFKVQDEIAGAVVQALQIKLAGGELSRRKGGTQNLEAYQLYLRANSAISKNTKLSVTAAGQHLEQAVKLDPLYGMAWSTLAFSTIVSTDNGWLDSTYGYARARQLAQHALQLSPDLANAHASLQYVSRTLDWDWSAAETEGQLALAIDPTNVGALHNAGMFSYTLGRWDDAIRHFRTALVRDPLNTYVIWNLGTAYYLSGRFTDAEATYRKLLELAPHFLWTRAYLGKTLLVSGRPEEALAMVKQEADEDNRLLFLPSILHALGRQVEADEALKAQIAQFADTGASYYVALTYAYRGDRDLALQWLEHAYDKKDHDLVQMLGEPLFKNLVDDPRFKAFLRKMNLPEENAVLWAPEP